MHKYTQTSEESRFDQRVEEEMRKENAEMDGQQSDFDAEQARTDKGE